MLLGWGREYYLEKGLLNSKYVGGGVVYSGVLTPLARSQEIKKI